MTRRTAGSDHNGFAAQESEPAAPADGPTVPRNGHRQPDLFHNVIPFPVALPPGWAGLGADDHLTRSTLRFAMRWSQLVDVDNRYHGSIRHAADLTEMPIGTVSQAIKELRAGGHASYDSRGYYELLWLHDESAARAPGTRESRAPGTRDRRPHPTP